MKNMDNKNFNWEDLLGRIHRRKVIPVIGQNLLRVKTGEGEEILLYDHLAEKMAKAIGFKLLPETNHKFSKMVFQFLKTNDSDKLRQFIQNFLQSVQLIPEGPLWQLACIKPFSIFINTTYDTFLFNTLKTVRNNTTYLFSFSIREKVNKELSPDLLEPIEKGKSTLVCNIYGSVEESQAPAYVEKDILETVVAIQDGMNANTGNQLFNKLKDDSLLFIGCGYDDWLFRFFARALSMKPYNEFESKQEQSRKFISDNFQFSRGELAGFLEDHCSEVFCSFDGIDFVNELFQKLGHRYPEDIIGKETFPRLGFISFNGKDRKIADQLVSNLREDGINIWLDDRELIPGSEVDKTIATAIENSLVFIPLISNASKEFKKNDNRVSYHIQEWNWACFLKTIKTPPIEIIPVKIEDLDWVYNDFDGLVHVKIPGGNREEEYEKLKDRLLELQNKIRGGHENTA